MIEDKGVAFGPVPTRHPTLLAGRRSVPPKLWGWWMMVTSFQSFATRRKPRGWLSRVIFMLRFASKSITPEKPAIFRLPDSFTEVSELKRAPVQEAWRIMVLFFISMKCY